MYVQPELHLDWLTEHSSYELTPVHVLILAWNLDVTSRLQDLISSQDTREYTEREVPLMSASNNILSCEDIMDR